MTEHAPTGKKSVETKTKRGQGKSRFAHPTLGFGVPATTDPHHFLVSIPKNNNGVVLISEYLGMQAQDQNAAIMDRVLLERRRWTAMRSEVQRAFNVRLKEHKLQTSAWKVGDNMVDRLLGKELCVLAWAIEAMEFDHIPIAVRNWLALRPEERWWLYGMAAISTGGVKDGNKGWRLALRHALGDVAQNEQIIQYRKAMTPKADQNDPALSLF
ncbi:anti-phage-associated DUF3780 domain-containing protein [Endozoicomonas sp. ALC020]|uniref:anti-phage-associated DUF3780 domain-containing protein n=1 Tax=unclassified Endozoicomonas TaxID=2644528 RepID=UPI003BAF9E82